MKFDGDVDRGGKNNKRKIGTRKKEKSANGNSAQHRQQPEK